MLEQLSKWSIEFVLVLLLFALPTKDFLSEKYDSNWLTWSKS